MDLSIARRYLSTTYVSIAITERFAAESALPVRNPMIQLEVARVVRWNGDRKLVPYTLRVERDQRFKHPKSTGEPFVANFDGAGGDLLVSVSSFLNGLPRKVHINRDNRHFGKPASIVRKGRMICWRMDGGESGRSSSIVLKRGGKTRTRQQSGIEWAPYWAMAVVPKDTNHGWLFIEKDGKHTLPTEWRDELARQFAQAHKGYRLVVSTIREESLWSSVENALDEARVVGFEVAIRGPKNATPSGYTRGMVEVNRRAFRSAAGLLPGRRLREFRRRHTVNLSTMGIKEIDVPIDQDDLANGSMKIRLRDDVVELKATVLNANNVERTIVFEGIDGQQSFVMAGTSGGAPNQVQFMTECKKAVSDLATSGGLSMAPGWDNGKWNHPTTAPKMKVDPDDKREKAS